MKKLVEYFEKILVIFRLFVLRVDKLGGSRKRSADVAWYETHKTQKAGDVNLFQPQCKIAKLIPFLVYQKDA